MNRTSYLTTIALAAIMLAPAAMLCAQDEFDFDRAPVAPPPQPAAGAAGARNANTGDLIIDTVRESNPTTPEELLRAVQVLRDYGATDEALGYLKLLIAEKPNQQSLAALTEEFGELLMIRLVTDKRMRPEGQEFGLAALEAYRNSVRDPARLSSAIDALSSDSSARQVTARADLRQAHGAAVDQMLIVLADPNRASEHRVIREAISTINPPALEMSLAALRSENPTLRRNASLIIGRLGNQRAAAYLVEPYLNQSNPPAVRQAAGAALARILGGVPDRAEALEFLEQTARQFEYGALVSPADELERVPHWQWSDTPPGFTRADLRSDDASLATAADLSKALYQLSPERVEARRRYLLNELERMKAFGGYDQSVVATHPESLQEFQRIGMHALDDALNEALEKDRIAAATAAAEVLGEIGSVSLLHAPDGYPRPLAAALSHGDSRLRYAAASAIAKLNPTRSYAGASRFAEAAAHMIRTEDLRRAVVCEPREQRTHTIAGLLGQSGIEGVATYTGKRAWEAAAHSPDVEMVFLSWAIDRPNLNETLQMFRTDKRTKRLPIAVMTDDAHARKLAYLVADDPLSIVVPYPHSAETLAVYVDRLLDLLDRHYVDQQERVVHAKAALGWFEEVALHPEREPNHDLIRHYDALEQALFVPTLAEPAARVLGTLATPDAQQALLNFASQNGRPLAQRKAVAAAFERAVDRRNVQLTHDAIRRQYDRYNQSATLPVETQQVLGSLLDAIEKPTRPPAPPAANPPAESPPADT